MSPATNAQQGKKKKATMSYPTQELQANTLYLVISTPEALPYAIEHIYDRDKTTLKIVNTGPVPEGGGGSSSNGEGVHISGTEDFGWGLYWHRNLRDGTWYTLRQDSPSLHVNLPGFNRPINVFESFQVKQSPRLYSHVVGLVRIMRAPDMDAAEITSYLDWLAPRAATMATEPVMWAAGVYLRARRHVARKRGVLDAGAVDYNPTGLICEALQFGYREVWHALCGQLPRPIFEPDTGILKEAEEPSAS
ncbi:hypothetical protein ACJ41O_001065 [Fusarium nematophilum]